MHADKMKGCMNKDEVVLNTCVNSDDNTVKAYPLVVTTVGDMKTEVKEYLKTLYEKTNPSDFFSCRQLCATTAAADVEALKKACGYDAAQARPASEGGINKETWDPISQQITTLPDFRCDFVTL